jgi:hypothetical protein
LAHEVDRRDRRDLAAHEHAAIVKTARADRPARSARRCGLRSPPHHVDH